MAKLSKARVQHLNPDTGDVIEDVDVLTSADCVALEEGGTVEEKLGAINNIEVPRLDEIINSVIPNKPSTQPNNFYNKDQTDQRIKEEIEKAQIGVVTIEYIERRLKELKDSISSEAKL